MKIKDIKIAKKNPRLMGKEAKKALGRSLQAFDDISGITINKKTGNIVSGNHRWEELNKAYAGTELSLSNLKGEYHTLDSDGKFTGFIVRVVNWDEAKELAANVTANSNLVQGEFTSALQDVLEEIVEDFEIELFEDLRLDELQIDIDDIDDLDWDDGALEEQSRKRNDELQNSSAPEVAEVREVITTLKLNVPGELKDKVRKDLEEFLSKKPYYDQIVIV